MWTAFKDFLFLCIDQIHQLVGDWGLAIIIMTVILRLIVMPLTIKSQKSMASMQALQPRIKAIQEQYSHDPQRLNEEMMRFYSETKFNPLRGCLPLFIQMPIFIALFQVLRQHMPADSTFYNFVNLVSSPSEIFHQFGVVAAIPYLLLALGFGILTLLPMMIMQNDSKARIMGGVMTVMMIFFAWSSPAGVLLYWDASSGWGLVQQLLITKKIREKTLAEEKAKYNNIVQVDVTRTVKRKRPKPKK